MYTKPVSEETTKGRQYCHNNCHCCHLNFRRYCYHHALYMKCTNKDTKSVSEEANKRGSDEDGEGENCVDQGDVYVADANVLDDDGDGDGDGDGY